MNGDAAARPGAVAPGAPVAPATASGIVSPGRDGALIALFGAALLATELFFAERIGLPGLSADGELIFAHVSEFLLIFIIALSGATLLRSGRTAGGRFLLAMSLLPLTRLLALAPFSTTMVASYPYFILGALSVAALIPVLLMMRAQDLSWQGIGYRAPRSDGAKGILLALLTLAVAGGAAVAQYLILKPGLDDEAIRGAEVLVATVALLLATLQQETLFRGLLQTHGNRAFGAFGAVVWPALLFTLMHVGTLTASLDRTLLFLGVTLAAALVVGAQVRKSTSLWVALAAQFAANLVLYVLAPHVL